MEIIQNSINSIVIENNEEFEQFVIRLSNRINGEDFYFVSDEEKMTLFNRMRLIMSPFDLQISDRDLQKKLYAYLVEEIENSNTFEKLIEIHGNLVSCIDETIILNDYDIEYDDEFSIFAILKAIGAKLKPFEGSFCNKMVESAKVCRNFLGKDYFVICNCNSYINDQDYEYLEKWAKYNEITLVFLQNQQIMWQTNVNEYIIDKDLCVLH